MAELMVGWAWYIRLELRFFSGVSMELTRLGLSSLGFNCLCVLFFRKNLRMWEMKLNRVLFIFSGV